MATRLLAVWKTTTYTARTMATPTDMPDRRQSIAFSRWRDARIRWLLECHPVTAAMLVQIGWFRMKSKALRRLQKLVRRRRVRLVGTVCGWTRMCMRGMRCHRFTTR